MSKYLPGDVVWAKYPFQEDPTIFKDRLALVVSVYQKNGRDVYRLVKITGTDKTGRYPGKFIKQNSNEGKKMKLDKDSFIQLDQIADVEEYGVRQLRGLCPILPELEMIARKNGIRF